jgi:site-specific recombinase XerD
MKRLTETEVESLIQLARQSSLRDATMIALSFFHAMRASEVCDLKVSQVNLDRSSIEVVRKKGSLETTQALHCHKGKPHLHEPKLLAQWLKEKPEGEYMFPTQKGVKMNPRSWWRLFHGYCVALGIDPRLAKPHSLKHASATFLLRSGADLASVRQHLGHKSYQSTYRYLGCDSEQSDAVAQTIFSRI